MWLTVLKKATKPTHVRIAYLIYTSVGLIVKLSGISLSSCAYFAIKATDVMISNLNAWIQLNLRASLIKGKLKNGTVLWKATVNSDDLSGTGKNLPKVRP